MIELARRQAARRTPRDLLAQLGRDGFVAPVALECARRLVRDPAVGVRLATIHQVLRAQALLLTVDAAGERMALRTPALPAAARVSPASRS